MTTLRERVQHTLRAVFELRGRPEFLARGVAVGMWVGFFPIVGQTPVALFLAAVFRAAPVPAAIMVNVSNPVTWPIFLVFGYMVGQMWRGLPVGEFTPPESVEALASMGGSAYLSIWLGWLTFGAIMTPLSYFLTLYVARKKWGGGNVPQEMLVPMGDAGHAVGHEAGHEAAVGRERGET